MTSNFLVSGGALVRGTLRWRCGGMTQLVGPAPARSAAWQGFPR